MILKTEKNKKKKKKKKKKRSYFYIKFSLETNQKIEE